ncbi:MAG: hypothetical protein F6K50_17525 [Moorea sp. SIO3I7]|nr:hypothetical protein [Moorena sp. SIO3I7]NEO06248.1 hypothetical protein [Moorena sp. SIO3I8]NEP25289.1 hypothetical protein [Moorena sp. SIO3I6]
MVKLGIQLTVLIGSTVPKPASSVLIESLANVEVTHSAQERSGFQLRFRAGRSASLVERDYPVLKSGELKPFNRVILVVIFNGKPQVLMDGVITHQQLLPSNNPGESSIVVTGEDVSVMMDLEEKIVEHPAQNETIIANKIIASYAKYGLIPQVIPPLTDKPPLPTERIPVQHGTDLDYLLKMARRHGYVFYITPGPAPGTNTAYWGPPKRLGLPQSALSVNMGSNTNVESISFEYNALAATTVSGQVQDRDTNKVKSLDISSSKLFPLAQTSALKQSQVRTVVPKPIQGLSESQAKAFAQGITDTSLDDVVVAEGTLNALEYNGILQAGALVGVRGVGNQYDGFYYVKSVTHQLQTGQYKQQFVLTREGLGSTTLAVRP